MFCCMKQIFGFEDEDVISPIPLLDDLNLGRTKYIRNMELIQRLLESNPNEEESEFDGMENMHALDKVLDGFESTDDRFTENPEALLDLITMKSLKARYGNGHVQEERRQYSNDDIEFEHYVQQFPIDDKISECFSSSDDVMRKKSSFLSGGRRPPFMRSQNWKKKVGWKGSGLENNPLLMKEEDPRSCGSKRSRTIRRLLHMPRKSKTSVEKKANTYIPDAPSNDILSTWNNPCQDITNSNKKCKVREHPTKQTPCLVNRDPSDVKSGNQAIDNTKNGVNKQPDKAMRTLMDTTDAFSPILVDDSVNTIHHIRNLDPPLALKMRDVDGNNLLHRCVVMGQTDAVAETLVRFPGMCSDLNNDKMTPLELAARMGQVSCLQYLLSKTLNYNVLGMSLITRLMTISAVHGKEECLELLLARMPEVEHDRTQLPRDRRGNTVAHVAATHGQLNCLQLLVRKGFDICTTNFLGQRPLDISQQLKHRDCFQYLLLVEACRSLIDSRMLQCRINERLQNQFLDIAYLEQLRCDLQQVQNLFIGTRQSLEENKESVIHSLSLLHKQLGNFIANVSKEIDEEERKRKLNDIKDQIERLEDIFEFSPLAGVENAIERLLRSMYDVIQTADSSTEVPETLSNGEISIFFSMFLQRIHEKSTPDLPSAFQSVEKLFKQSTHGNSTVSSGIIKTYNTADDSPSTDSNCNCNKPHIAGQGNVSKEHSATVYLPRSCNFTLENQSLIHDDCMDSSVTLNDYEMLTYSYVSQSSPDGNTSVYTQTLTTVTPDTSPEETSHMTSRDCSNIFEESLISNDVTSESHSYWWDLHEIHPRDCAHVEVDIRNSGIKLNLDNEDAPNEQLRKERLRNHLVSMQNARNPPKDFIETITTAAGKHYGGPNSWQKRNIINVSDERTRRDKESVRYTKLSLLKPSRKLKVNNCHVTDVVKSLLLPDTGDCKPSDVHSISWHDKNDSYMGENGAKPRKAWYEVSDDDSNMSHMYETSGKEETDDNKTASNS